MDKQKNHYRWVVFAAVLLTYFLIVIQRTAPGLITDQLMQDFHVSAATIGLLASMQFLAYAGLQIPIGILSDRFGPNYFLIAGAILNGLGTIIYSLAANEYILIFSRLLVGMGDAAIWINLVLIMGRWFKVNEFVRLLGLAGMSGSLGFLMATVPYSAWISFAGWRIPFFTAGVILCLSGILLYFVLLKIPGKTTSGHSLSNKASDKIDKNKNREKTWVMLRRIFSDRQVWAAFLCHFGLVGTYVGFVGSWAVPYGMHVYGMSRSGASQLIMIGLIGALIGSPLSSWISSSLNSIKRPYFVVQLVVFLSWAAFLLSGGKPPFYMLITLFLLIGYGNGASALTFAVVRQSFPMKEVGVVSGAANMGGFLSAVLLPSIFGRVLDYFHAAGVSVGYRYGLIIPILFSFLGLMGAVLIKEQHKEIKPAGSLNE